MKWRLFVGLVILLIAGALRFYRLNEVPYGLSWDEAAFTYNGWSVSLWHRDEYANFMPLVFKSFGDYKPPLLVYTLGTIFKLSGLRVDMIRVVSAFSGIATVILMYLLAKEIRPKVKRWSLLVMALGALSPWAVHFSRLGYEANMALPLVGLGVLLLFKGLNNQRFWWMAAIVLASSLYAFHNAKITVPVLLLGFGVLNWQKIGQYLKKAMIATLLFIALSWPMVIATLYSGAGERGVQTLIFFEGGKLASFTRVTTELVTNVGNQLSLGFWIEGWDATSVRHMSPGYGVIYKVELVFLIIGLIGLIRSKNNKDRFVLWWLVAGLLPAILTHTTPHAVRSLLALPAVVLVIAEGMWVIYRSLESLGRVRWMIAVLLLLVYVGQIKAYLENYYTAYAVESATEFQYGYKEAVAVVNKYKNDKDKIVITDAYGQPYIYFLLYNQITPEQFLFGQLALYEFRTIHWPEGQNKTLYVGTPSEIPLSDPGVLEIITIPNTDKPVFVVAEVNE